MSSHKMNRGSFLSQKVPKVNRFKQMCSQQQLIEEKKRAIAEKLRNTVKKESLLPDEKFADTSSGTLNKRAVNIFSNDGSFLEEFKKLAERGDETKIKAKEEIKTEHCDESFMSSDSECINVGQLSVKKELCEDLILEDPSSLEKTPQLVEDGKFENQTSSQRERGVKRKSRWGNIGTEVSNVGTSSSPTITPSVTPDEATSPVVSLPSLSGHFLTKVTKRDKGLLQYAMSAYGSTDLSDEDWKKAEDNYKVHLLYQDMLQKRAEVQRLHAMGVNKYEYDSDEETDGGTWEHKAREKEMVATAQWAEQLTKMAKGKHHIGDFLPPEELKKFMDKYKSIKGGGEPDLSDYANFKLTEENKGFQMLQKLGWTEGQGLGADGSGIVEPLNKARSRDTNMGLGVERPDDLSSNDDEYDAYRKRMMLAYRFRPNPLNNPRRPYY